MVYRARIRLPSPLHIENPIRVSHPAPKMPLQIYIYQKIPYDKEQSPTLHKKPDPLGEPSNYLSINRFSLFRRIPASSLAKINFKESDSHHVNRNRKRDRNCCGNWNPDKILLSLGSS